MLTEPEFRALFDRLRRRSPWGPDDRRGALNNITQSSVLAAMREARLGLANQPDRHLLTSGNEPTLGG